MMDPIVALVRADLAGRSKRGLMEYGVGLDRIDLGLKEWLVHAYEETSGQGALPQAGDQGDREKGR